ncbi:gamma-glutamyltransferase [Sorangium sp. So ce1128]
MRPIRIARSLNLRRQLHKESIGRAVRGERSPAEVNLAHRAAGDESISRAVCCDGTQAQGGAGRAPIHRADLASLSPDEATRLAVRERADLVVVGPEAPLCAGVADTLAAAGIAVFGPSREAARLEGSKASLKEFAARHRYDGGEGRMTLDDLALYDVVLRTPVIDDYRGFTVASMPSPSSGGLTMIQILKMLERFPAGNERRRFGFGETIARAKPFRPVKNFPPTPGS